MLAWREPVGALVMLKKTLLPVALILMACAPAFAAKQPAGPVIKPLNRHLEDAGCSYYERKAKNDDFPIFLSDPEGTLMDIDGEVRQLTLDNDYEGKNSSRYTAGEYTIRLDYGSMKQYEGGISHGRVKMTVRTPKRSTVIKAKGGCGC
jgi:hypothetical protein